MSFKSVGMRVSALRVLGAATAALLLVSCGGGEQVEKFVPVRVLAFGDENSRIEDKVETNGDHNGDKYTINFKDATTGVRDCNQNHIWVQALASAYALLFPQCYKATATVPALSRIYATAGSNSTDVARQIQEFLATPDTFGSKDLVTMMAGANDIREQYLRIRDNGVSEDEAGAILDQRGADLAAQVNFVAKAGGKVLIATALDMGLTPFAVNETVANPDAAALLSRLTVRFNTKLRINLINDGHMIGLLLFDEQVQAISKTVGWTSNKAACDAQHVSPLTLCDTTTMAVIDATTTPPTLANGASFLWADDTHISSGVHSALASLALSRASNNPF
jgi:outer membrane lipase/esterase